MIGGVTIPSSDYTWLNDGEIVLDAVPATGLSKEVRRTTPRSAPAVVFSTGNITSQNLNTEVLQLLYITQEQLDTVLDTRSLRVPLGESVGDLPPYAELVSKLLYFDELRRPVGFAPNQVDIAQTGPDTVGSLELKVNSIEEENYKAGSVSFRAMATGLVRMPATADVEVFVAAAGSNLNPGTTVAPYATIEYAYERIKSLLDMRGFSLTIKVRGTLNVPGWLKGEIDNCPWVYVEGDTYSSGDQSTWGVASFNPATDSMNLSVAYGARVHVRGIRVGHNVGNGLVSIYNGILRYSNIKFYGVEAVNGTHVWATQGGQADAFLTNLIYGGAGSHIQTSHLGRFRITNDAANGVVSITFLQANVTFNIAAIYVLNGEVILTAVRPVGGAFNPAGFTATGRQFFIDGVLATIQCYGTQWPLSGDIFGTINGKAARTEIRGGVLYSYMMAPALTTGTINDYHPVTADFVLSDVSTVCVSASGAITITGLFSGTMVDGQAITLINVGGTTWTLKNNDAGSIAADRMILGADFTLASAGCITLQWIGGFWFRRG